MNKFLEDAARAQAGVLADLYIKTRLREADSRGEFIDSTWRNYLGAAQAVFDSAKILLLPADAEPMDGDLIKFEDSIGYLAIDWEHPTYEETFEPYQVAYILNDDGGFERIIENEDKTIEDYLLSRGVKIIAREGYNAVLQES